MGTAWIVTHPETNLDKEGRLHGSLDGSLNSAGKSRAHKIASEMATKPVKRILSSPRLRARQTAEAISKATGAKVHVLQDLKPWDAGSLSGAKVDSVKPVVEHYSANPDKSPRGGETKRAFLDRFSRVAKMVKPGDVIAGHSQHALAWDYARHGGDAAKVPLISGKSGQIKAVKVNSDRGTMNLEKMVRA